MKKRIVKALLSLSLVAAMSVTSVMPAMAGASTNPFASYLREQENAQISQEAATEGMVLLDNEAGVLPIAKSGAVALYGTGVYATVKGGTGSGDVYLKDGANIDVQQGFEEAGYNIVNESFLAEMEADYNDKNTGTSGWGSYAHDEPLYNEEAVTEAAAATDTAIYVLTRNSGEGSDRTATTGDYYLTDNEAANLAMLGEKFDKVIVVLNVGGIVDTNFYNGKGGYGADDELNRGKIEGLDALFLMSQAGQNGGHALVEVLNGTVNPSGKLTDTWAVDFTDYPSSGTFSHIDGETLEEVYADDIYVGYRYFDTFGVDVAYEFGYGDSYTDFAINVKSVTADANKVTVTASVKNTGKVDGKEVVEVYFSAPAGALDKPYQELAAYQKVAVKAGATEEVTVSFDTTDMSSYDESKDAYVMEDGDYIIRVGNSSRNTVAAATLTLDKDVITEQCQNNLGLTKDSMQAGTYEEGAILHNKYTTTTNENGQTSTTATPQYGTAPVTGMLDETSEGYGTGITPSTEGLTASAAKASLTASTFAATVTHDYQNGAITTYVSADASTDSAKYAAGKTSTATETLQTVAAADNATLVDVVEGKITVEQLVADMSNTELADLVEGGTYDGLSAGSGEQSAVIGSQADSVYGAAGETTSNLYTSRYIPNIVMSDGPAGIRITNSYIKYDLVPAGTPFDANTTYYTSTYSWSGNVYTAQNYTEAEYNAAVADGVTLYTTDNRTYYQYCTAMPIGTLLAQTWDPEVIERVGRAVGVEMLEYGVTSWLAPGMNIHRSPLCGRNFEYYSEDPLLAGTIAAAETKGVETNEDGTDSGVGVTLKHFAFNNQENSRMGSNSVVSERAAREIYLKGFEIAVKASQPDYIMSSYNMVNGYSTFENYGLLTEILRNEWSFEGFVMTDWYSVWGVQGMNKSKNVQAMLMYAGNDCEMPGGNEQNILTALEEGTEMRLGDLQRSAINMLNVIKRSEVFNIMKAKLDAAAKDTTIKELKEQLAAANEKVQQLQNTPSVSAAELKKAQDELAAAKKELAAAQKGKIVTDKAKYTVKKGKTVKITAVASNGKKLKFTSKNKKIAKVTAKGKIRGIKKGTTKIVIKAGTAKKTVKVTVK